MRDLINQFRPHFKDPEWDGTPEEPEPGQHETREPKGEYEPRARVKIKLADGKEREIEDTLCAGCGAPRTRAANCCKGWPKKAR